jgi:glutathione S-transferase
MGRYKAQKYRMTNKEELDGLKSMSRELLGKCAGNLERSGGPWLFGASPTAVDANLAAFLQRLQDAGHFELLDDTIIRYLDNARATPEWKSFMGDQRTLPQEIVVQRP